MAYLDDNNENLYSRGNLLDELDKELEDLKAKLDKLESDSSNPETSENKP